MSVNLKNFVNINLNYFVSTTNNGTRDTAVLFEVNDTSGSKLLQADKTYSSFQEFTLTTNYTGTASDELYKYVRCFFENNGKKLRIVRMPVLETGETIQSWLETQLAHLPMEQIVVGSTATESDMRAVATAIAADDFFKGINEKIIVSHIDILTGFTFPVKENYVLKYNNRLTTTGEAVGSEMSILAYLTKINITGNKPISDYCYTKEVAEFSYPSGSSTVTYTYVENDNENVMSLMNNNCNVDTSLINEILVVGGNTTAGKDLVNHFVRIVLTQTLTERLVKLLSTKIRYNQTSINLVANNITTELNRYKNFGYITDTKVWEEDDLYVTVGSKQYLLISKGEPLNTGYKYLILPFDSLSDEEKQKHLLPKIFLLVADSYSIRAIEISGWVY